VTTQRIPVAGGALELAVDTWAPPGGATGPAMLLVHGLASNALLWNGVAGHLLDLGHPVGAVDLRGHGRSDKPDAGYDIPTICDDLVAVLGRLREEDPAWERPVAVGQSWGGNVVLELAFREPGLLRGIACVDGGTIDLQGRFESWAECALMLAPPRLAGTPAAKVETFLHNAHPTWPETGIQGTMGNFEVHPDGTVAPWLTFKRHIMVLRGLWEHRPGTRYPDLTAPVLLIPADDGHGPSTAAKRQEVEAAAAAIPLAEVVWFHGDHDLHAQFPGELAAVLHDAGTGGILA
jgi:pimeloyl-ACP methyl ester carboxylesterase